VLGKPGIVGVNVTVYNHVWGEHATEFLATGTSVRRLGDEHRLPATSPKPTVARACSPPNAQSAA
jgi:hypothetical protein